MRTQPRHIFLTVLVACLTMIIGIGFVFLAIQLEQQHQSDLVATLIECLGAVLIATKIILLFFVSSREKWRVWKSPLISYTSFLLAKKLNTIFVVTAITSGFLYGAVLAFHEKYDVFSAHWEILLIGLFSVCLALGMYGYGVTGFFLQRSQIGRAGYLTGVPAMVNESITQLIGAGLLGGLLFLVQILSSHPV